MDLLISRTKTLKHVEKRSQCRRKENSNVTIILRERRMFPTQGWSFYHKTNYTNKTKILFYLGIRKIGAFRKRHCGKFGKRCCPKVGGRWFNRQR